MVLAVATVMVAMLVAASVPAMADVVFDDGSGVVFTSNDGFFDPFFNPFFGGVNNSVSQSIDSGTVDLSFTVS